MEFTITASFTQSGSIDTSYRKLKIEKRNDISLVPNNQYAGTIFKSVEKVREVLIDALQNPKKYEALAYGSESLTLQVNCHGPRHTTYHDTVKLQFRNR